MKKFLLLTLCTALLFTMVFSLGAAADTGKTLDVTSTLDKTTVEADESFTQTISLGNFSANIVDGVRAFQIKAVYDSTKFNKPVVSYPGQVLSSEVNVNNADGYITLLYADTEHGLSPVTGGDVLSLAFTAKADATDGPVNITLSTTVTYFIDCSYRQSSLGSEVVLRNITPTFVEATKTVTVDNGPVLASSVYTVSGNNISGVPLKTLTPAFVTNVKTNPRASTIRFFDKDNQELATGSYIGTGNKVEVYSGTNIMGTYYTMILGDTTGDGQRTVADLIALKNHLINKVKLEGLFAAAADVNSEAGLNILDLMDLKAAVIAG